MVAACRAEGETHRLVARPAPRTQAPEPTSRGPGTRSTSHRTPTSRRCGTTATSPHVQLFVLVNGRSRALAEWLGLLCKTH
jgi:hypothetical protein